ncbi:cytochrome P450 monooxygenase [Fusarium bulbicola]|nr:cytochrome P450 monooxygenase [Fusarium bulbicola]
MASSNWLLYGALITGLVLFHLIRLTFRTGLRNIPGPRLARYTGLYRPSLVYKGDSPRRYQLLHEKYGPIVRTGPNHVSVSDPAMIPVIYGIGKNFQKVKTPFYTTMSLMYQGRRMDSMFTERNPNVHKALKSSVAQIFSMANMRNFEVYADECSAIFLDAMRDLEGQRLDLAHWLQWYAFDVIGSLTFQRRFGFLERRHDVDEMISKINHGLELVKIVGQSEWLVALFDKLYTNSWMRENYWPDTMDKFLKITEKELDKYDQSSKEPSRTDFLSQLREKQDKTGKITHRDMINHLSNNLLAGSDTTGISLRAVVYFVIKTPQVYEKLQKEIDEADQAGHLSEYVTYQESLKLPYFQATLKEAMRMHPAVGFPLERYVPDEGAQVCGHSLPAGTNISTSAPLMHMNKGVFGHDARVSRPERWLEALPEQLSLMDRTFIAFGHGSRTCIGKNISLMEMGKLIPQLFRHFDIEWASEQPEWHTHATWFWKQSDLFT